MDSENTPDVSYLLFIHSILVSSSVSEQACFGTAPAPGIFNPEPAPAPAPGKKNKSEKKIKNILRIV